jgi:hypothetical protein
VKIKIINLNGGVMKHNKKLKDMTKLQQKICYQKIRKHRNIDNLDRFLQAFANATFNTRSGNIKEN